VFNPDTIFYLSIFQARDFLFEKPKIVTLFHFLITNFQQKDIILVSQIHTNQKPMYQ